MIETTGVPSSRLLHELQIHQIELELQNEQLIEARNAAEQATASFTELYDFAPVGYVTLNFTGHITRSNLAAAQLLGMDRKQLQDKRLAAFVAQTALPKLNSLLSTSNIQSSQSGGEIVLAGMVPRNVWIDINLSDNNLEYRLVLTDITERKQAELATQKAKSAAEALAQYKSLFLANMSHEIRTPLTTVIGQAEAIICRDVKPENIYKEVEIIHDSSLYLLALLNDILDLAKIEENKFELEYSPQNLHNLMININTMFSMQARVKGLKFSLTENLPTPYIVNIDRLRLKQILINLLSNALKFTISGYVSLEVKLTDTQLTFNIKDSGIGISQDKITQIFSSFTQGDNSIRRRFGGSGLGLHLSNQLAILMRGNISVRSEVDKGSVFTFRMPIPELSEGYEKPHANFDVDSSLSASLFSGKILLAEDHPDNRRLITRLLTKLGLTVYAAADGFEAVEMYKKHDPEIVLMDIQMPKMDGLQAYKALRELGYEKPIIALTANAMSNEVEEYFSLGFDGYIEKPIDRQMLISTIATFYIGKNEDAMSQASSILGNVDMSDLVNEFKIGLAKELEQFSIEADKLDAEVLRAQAHRLSGASQLFGFAILSQKATALEIKVKQGSQSFEELQPDLGLLIDEIERILVN